MGRIGRLALRSAMGGASTGPRPTRAHRNCLDVVHINELKGGNRGDRTSHSNSIAIHGRWNESGSRSKTKTTIMIDGHRLDFSEHANPGGVAWGDLGCDVILECTGKIPEAGAASRPISTKASNA